MARELVVGDRVKITGPWNNGGSTGGEDLIGSRATVVKFNDLLGVGIRLDGDPPDKSPWWWCRENLRALPRKAK